MLTLRPGQKPRGTAPGVRGNGGAGAKAPTAVRLDGIFVLDGPGGSEFDVSGHQVAASGVGGGSVAGDGHTGWRR